MECMICRRVIVHRRMSSCLCMCILSSTPVMTTLYGSVIWWSNASARVPKYSCISPPS